MNQEIEANPDDKRPVRGRFQVPLAADWTRGAAASVGRLTGATITLVDGPILEGAVELETRAGIAADEAVYDCVEAGLGCWPGSKAPRLRCWGRSSDSKARVGIQPDGRLLPGLGAGHLGYRRRRW